MNIVEKELFDNVVNIDDWQNVIKNVFEKAKNGDLNAIKFLFDRRFGKAKEHKEIKTEITHPTLNFEGLSDAEKQQFNDLLGKIAISENEAD